MGGRSALFFLNYFPASQLVCVDTFGGNIEHMRNPHFAALIAETEQRFDFQCRRLRRPGGEDQGIIRRCPSATRH